MSNDYKVNFDAVRTLVVIDDAVGDFQSLVKVLLPLSKVIIIQPNDNEIEQITQTLNKCTRLKNLHIISNGSPGCLYFGKSHLSLFALRSHASQLKTWTVQNILLYGCNVAAGNVGKEFIKRLHLLTGANIGASIWNVDDTTKGICLQLNYFVGEINSHLAILPSRWHTNPKAFQDW
ncbi:hypothetical protein Riv7116_0403 [Rivularia sp. PCC 7116]|uniref:DUF4347 domain-containing protein n=1 Tax=Rivularia sp. PCC 7116 TaxID=373994 RepID=UPI00029EEA89|nr:DUF4347 domain-containing protein [Rivularia sp. PCC 7116]AFY53007.1 hypothetical protein Riv7116_0403 [Rivularia sp. PCC 7116]